MSVLTRLYDFLAGTTIVSDQVDNELNQLIGLWSAGSTDKNASIKFSDPSIPPIDSDQLGNGLLARWKKAGSALATITNAGSFSTTQQFVSSLATGTKPVDVTSTTVCTNLNADMVDGLHASSFVQTTGGTISGDLTISSANPKLTFADTTSGDDDYEMSADGDNFTFKISGGSNVLTVAGATQVLTFVQIPVGPSSNPTTDDQLSRKAYVDSKTTAWSSGFYYFNPPSATETTETVPRFICPTGTTIKITKLRVVFGGGSHTSGATLTWTIKRRNSSGTLQSDVGTVTLDNTNGTANTVYTNDIGDVTLSDGDQIYSLLTTRSGTITEQLISIFLIGTQTVIT
jgi:hypothetical protein